MSIKFKSLDEIEEADLQGLIDNQVTEAKVIEYKSELPSNSDGDKKEFMADASSLANTMGGDLIFGVEAPAGVPNAIVSLSSRDPDGDILRLENILRDGVEPRIPGVGSRAVPLSHGGHVIVMRFPKSFARPHRIKYQDWSRVYARSSNGKYLMDVAELRAAFLASETLADRITAFRADRIAQVAANQTPVPMPEGAKVIIHVLPLVAFETGTAIDLSSLPEPLLKPIGASGWNPRHNFEGFVTHQRLDDTKSYTYLQTFRNGALEAVESRLLAYRERMIPSGVYEREVMEALAIYLRLSEQMGLGLPLWVGLALTGVRGFKMWFDQSRFIVTEESLIDRDILVLPEILVDHRDVNAATVLRPAFDAIWNACGWARSMNYDQDGNWNAD